MRSPLAAGQLKPADFEAAWVAEGFSLGEFFQDDPMQMRSDLQQSHGVVGTLRLGMP